jgi:hypothetical protein
MLGVKRRSTALELSGIFLGPPLASTGAAGEILNFTQNIGIKFAGFCKFDNSLGDHLIGKVAAVCNVQGDASHFECHAHDTPGLGIKFGIAQKLCDRHGRRLRAIVVRLAFTA